MLRIPKLFGLAFLAFALCGSAFAQYRKSIQLLNEDTGWASNGRQLFFTTNAGKQWTDITPLKSGHENLASVFFLDISTAWVLLSDTAGASEEPEFDLASTTDAGTSWSVTHVNIPNLDAASTTLSGDGQIDFVDSFHGWMNLEVVSSSNFSLGAMVQTSDGGKTWTWSVGSPGVAGAIRFLNTKEGWLAGGPGGEHLYVTRDGAKSWQELVLKAPPQANLAVYPVYDLPGFNDAKHGSISVTYSGPEDSGLAFALFTTDDDGMTWSARQVISQLPEIYSGVPMPSAVVGSSLLVTVAAEHTRLSLKKLASAAQSASLSASVVPEGSSIDELSFATASRGWVRADRQIFSTTDGGATWINITPPERAGSVANVGNLSTDLARGGIDQLLNNSATRGDSIHLGFHKCNAPSQNNMATWWTSSPFFDAGVYIGGSSRTCANAHVKASWITNIENQGWGLMPLWVGPQAPCACRTKNPCVPFPNTFSGDSTTAQTQGVAEANSAASVASALGLADAIIYYDMEQYDSSQCGGAVKAFVNGWVNQLHANGYGTGVYGAPADAKKDWWLASYPPDDVWISKTFTNSLASPMVAIWGLSPLPDSLWGTTPGSRIHQYLGNHSVTWGTVTLGIDHDFEDGEIVAGNGDKSYTFNYTNIDFPAAMRTDAYGIANISQSGEIGKIVGAYQFNGIGHGFVRDASGAFSTFDYPGATRSIAAGINDVGQIVGWYADQNGDGHGFLYSSGVFSSIDYPGGNNTFAEGINDAGQITGIYRDSAGLHGFLYYAGNYYHIGYPGGDNVTYAYGINGAAQVVGMSAVNSSLYAFMGSTGPLDWANYGFQIIDYLSAYPSATDLSVSGISNNDQVAGWVSDDTGFHGFLYHNNVFDPVVYPGPVYTFPHGVNDAAQVVGTYNDSSGGIHAFVAIPQ